jgi:hypothetical protein
MAFGNPGCMNAGLPSAGFVIGTMPQVAGKQAGLRPGN